MFFLQLFTGHVLACNRVFRSVIGNQGRRMGRNFRARTCNLDIRNIRDDFDGWCLLYDERYVLDRGIHEMCELTPETNDV